MGGGERGVARRGARALTSKLAKGEKRSAEEKERGGKRCALTARINTLAERWSCAGTCRRWDWLQLHHVSILHPVSTASHFNANPTQLLPTTTTTHPSHTPNDSSSSGIPAMRCTAGCCAAWTAACSAGGTRKGSGGGRVRSRSAILIHDCKAVHERAQRLGTTMRQRRRRGRAEDPSRAFQNRFPRPRQSLLCMGVGRSTARQQGEEYV